MSEKKEIIIVSGLPRSGTSMMMKMLDAGGYTILTDNERKADIDNPKGYFELEAVKKIKEDSSWLPDAVGKVFKMVSMLLKDLPTDGYIYKVIFMRRTMDEILASEAKMLTRLGKNRDTDDAMMKMLFEKHLKDVLGWVKNQNNFSMEEINFNNLLSNPVEEIKKLTSFLNCEEKTEDFLSVIDPTLYRNRS